YEGEPRPGIRSCADRPREVRRLIDDRVERLDDLPPLVHDRARRPEEAGPSGEILRPDPGGDLLRGSRRPPESRRKLDAQLVGDPARDRVLKLEKPPFRNV